MFMTPQKNNRTERLLFLWCALSATRKECFSYYGYEFK